MNFVDELTIAAKAGDGGDGVVRWLHLKGKEYSGPAGGNGGNGGDVYIRAVRDLNLLARYRGEKRFEADSGADGESANRAGAQGSDLTVDLPVGSVVRNKETGEVYELLKEGDTKMVLKGGRGGAGNAVFKSSINRTPNESTPGQPGETADFQIELRLIADAGLVGLPNAGKTSLLNALTGAFGKVASYAFTTLDPNLGVLYGYVLADIPGLIEGASGGKGLGFKFLRHIARTKVLIHCVSLESDDPLRDYKVVRKELTQFEGGELEHKPELIILTKSDTRELKEIERISAIFSAQGGPASGGKHTGVKTVSVLDDQSVKELGDYIVKMLHSS